MSGLADFLLARIAEQERAILDGWDSDGKARVASMWTGGEPGFTTVASDHADGRWVAAGREVEDPRHIQVLWDPARTLAECAAKRRIVERFQETAPTDSPYGRGWADARTQEIHETLADEVLPFLALPYADHDDYNESWRP